MPVSLLLCRFMSVRCRRMMCGLMATLALLGNPAHAQIASTQAEVEATIFLNDEPGGGMSGVSVQDPIANLDGRDGGGAGLAPPVESGGDPRWSRDYLAIAGGVISAPSYVGSDNRILIPGFYLRGRVSGYGFSTRGTNVQVDLIRQRRGQATDFKFGPILNLRSDRTGHIRDAAVEALGQRKLAVEAGLVVGVSHSGVLTGKYDQISFRITALQDMSGRHGSWLVSPTIEYGTPLSRRAYVGVSASVNLYGKGFGGYYYDVDAAGSAASGLPVYRGAGAKTTLGRYAIGAAAAYALERDLRKGLILIGGVQYGRMTSRFARSPIVRMAGDRDQWIFGAGLAYNF